MDHASEAEAESESGGETVGHAARGSRIGLVHLVWAPLGPAPLRRFLRSYHAHPTGIEHELVVVLNGVEPPSSSGEARDSSGDPRPVTHESLLRELEGTDHRLISLERPVLDLAAYGLAAQQLGHQRVCFLNSYSVILADGWLAYLERALQTPGVGLAGATASWESQAEWVRGRARYWPYQLATLRSSRRDYPRFPNPHLRSTAFMLERQLVLDLDLARATDKRSTYLLESGPRSITTQVLERGLRAVVVGRDGRAYELEDWSRSATFRAGGQVNLLVGDNRTADWQDASPRLRRRLSRDSWGEPL